jgi:hypothetical protein
MNLPKAAWIIAAVLTASLTACSSGSPAPLASQIAPGSRAVPCSQITSQIKAILPYYTNLGLADDGHLYQRETALANKFGNVSNLDPPVSVSKAEVNYESDVLNGGYITQNDPYSSAVQDDLEALAAACGVQQ